MIKALKSAFYNYANFTGTASRPEFWWFWLFTIVVELLFAFIFGDSSALTIYVYGFLAIPSLSVGTRRLRDINKSGWWQLLWIASFLIIPAIYLIYLYARPSSNSNVCNSCGTESQTDEEAIFCASCGEKTI